MIIMDLKIDNLYAFKDFHINFSYPKKIVDSYIESECLTGFPNFRYKKVNILMGANASGKTTLGLVIMAIFNFINESNKNTLLTIVDDMTKEASFSIDFVTDGALLNRVSVKIFPAEENDEDESKNKVLVSVKSVRIGTRDRYETCCEKLDKQQDNYSDNYIETLQKLDKFGWYFTYPKDTLDNKKRLPKNDALFSEVLKKVLMSFDIGIIDVKASLEVDNAYIISLDNKTLVMQDGEFVKDEKVLSSGTKSGIDIALMIYSLIAHQHGFYYCDEKFSYVHSDLEKAFLILMISLLGSNEQLFFTTHNTDILDLPLPKHAFTFLKKTGGDENKIIGIDASTYLKKSTDSLRNAVDNDLFGIAPSLDLIYEIEDLSKNMSSRDKL